MEYLSKPLLCVFALGIAVAADCLWAQPTVRFPDTNAAAYSPGAYSSNNVPQAGTPERPAMGGAPSSSLGAPFDPYSSNPGMGAGAPSFSQPPSGPGAGMPSTAPSSQPPATPPNYPGTGHMGGGTPAAPPAPNVPAAPYSQPYGGYPSAAAPGTAPPALYPDGWNPGGWSSGSIRFLTPRIRSTYVNGGDNANDLGIHDFDFSVAATFPNFLYSDQPLYVIPSFSLHLWQGPQPPNGDLPANAYSAFLDAGWSTDPARPVGGEAGVRVGVFSDFNTFTTNSFRIMGHGLFRVRTTPTTVVRGGVSYINRNKLKLLPAFGVLWTPNSQTRFDVFFPRPKLAQRLTTLGTQDVWWYVGGEYGGGAWTIERASGSSERIDINDIRLILGVEWGQGSRLREGRRTGFLEAGWVTEREIIYVGHPQLSPSMDDTFMFRAGWNY